MLCKNCNTENNSNAIFCKSCGARIDGKIICPTCNFANKETDTFCSKCGARIDGKKFCANCGSEVEGIFCTTCGQKYSAHVHKNKVLTSNKTSFVSNILNLTSNSILLLGAILSLIFIFFIGFTSKNSTSRDIFYFLSDAYKNLKLSYPGYGKYSASLEISSYFVNILTTVTVSFSIIGCITFAVLSIVRFFKKICFNSEKSPALFSLLTIAFYIICAVSFENIFYTYVAGAEDITNIEMFKINSVTKTGIILTVVCALTYYLINIVNKALTLNKIKTPTFVLSIATTLTLIAVFILSNNMFVTATFNDIDTGTITISYPMLSVALSSSSYIYEMIGGVVISNTIQLLSIAVLFIALIAISKSMDTESNTLSYSFCISILLLLIMILSFVVLGIYEEFMSISGDLKEIYKYITLSSPLVIVSFVVSLIPLALSITNTILSKNLN